MDFAESTGAGIKLVQAVAAGSHGSRMHDVAVELEPKTLSFSSPEFQHTQTDILDAVLMEPTPSAALGSFPRRIDACMVSL